MSGMTLAYLQARGYVFVVLPVESLSVLVESLCVLVKVYVVGYNLFSLQMTILKQILQKATA